MYIMNVYYICILFIKKVRYLKFIDKNLITTKKKI